MKYCSKLGISMVLLSFSVTGFAGQVIYKNMYSDKNVIQGFGQTAKDARLDASSAKPMDYMLDPDNSWYVWEMRNGDWMASRPIVQSTIENAAPKTIPHE